MSHPAALPSNIEQRVTVLLLMAVASTMLTVPMVAPKLARMNQLVTQAA